MLKRFACAAYFLLLSFQISCTNKSKLTEDTDINSIKIGTIAGPETELMEIVKKIAWQEQQLKIDLIEFNDFMTPNIALDEGSINANAFQHFPYLQEANLSRGFNFTSLASTFIYPMAAYSKKVKNISELSIGAKIAIPNDPSNEGRALLLLESKGLISLKKGTGLTASIQDIESNPKKFKFIELEAAQLPRSLEDLDIAIINTVYAVAANLNPSKDGIFMEAKDSPYANIVAIREADKDKSWTTKLIKSIQHPEIKLAADRLFAGSALPAWN